MPIRVHPMLLRVVALISGRIFLGTPLNRNEDLIQTTIRFTIDILDSSRELLRYPKFLRPIALFFIPGLRAIPTHLRTISRILGPVIKERIKAQEQDPELAKPSDMMQWIMDNCPPEKRGDVDFYTLGQLNLSFVATHTTTMASTHAIFDLATWPEYQQELRQELDEVIAEDGGILSQKQSLTKLKKVSSRINNAPP
jgi:hypothetical protein